jgi:hypothetical protein
MPVTPDPPNLLLPTSTPTSLCATRWGPKVRVTFRGCATTLRPMRLDAANAAKDVEPNRGRCCRSRSGSIALTAWAARPAAHGSADDRTASRDGPGHPGRVVRSSPVADNVLGAMQLNDCPLKASGMSARGWSYRSGRDWDGAHSCAARPTPRVRPLAPLTTIVGRTGLPGAGYDDEASTVCTARTRGGAAGEKSGSLFGGWRRPRSDRPTRTSPEDARRPMSRQILGGVGHPGALNGVVAHTTTTSLPSATPARRRLVADLRAFSLGGGAATGTSPRRGAADLRSGRLRLPAHRDHEPRI